MGRPIVQFPLVETARVCGDTCLYARPGDAVHLAELHRGVARRPGAGRCARRRRARARASRTALAPTGTAPARGRGPPPARSERRRDESRAARPACGSSLDAFVEAPRTAACSRTRPGSSLLRRRYRYGMSALCVTTTAGRSCSGSRSHGCESPHRQAVSSRPVLRRVPTVRGAADAMARPTRRSRARSRRRTSGRDWTSRCATRPASTTPT